MNYELAKQLKDAGFEVKPVLVDERIAKQSGGGVSVICKHYPGRCPLFSGKCDDVEVPTLSELIDACDAKTNGFVMEFENNEWRADATWKTSDCKGIGSTPEESVAKLWIALNNTQ